MRGRKPPHEAPAVRRGPSWGYLRSADAIRGPTCDNWNFNASNPCLYVGGNYNQNTNHGLFYVNYNSVSNSNANIGCRNLFVIMLILNSMAQVVAHLLVKICNKGSGLVHPSGRWKARIAKRRIVPYAKTNGESLGNPYFR